VSRDAVIQANLRERTRQAHIESEVFDFVCEGEALATFYRQATPGTTYWRCHIPAQYLPANVAPIEPDSLTEVDENTIALKYASGALVWQFLGDDGRTRIALQMQRQGWPTFMEVDDNYLRFAPPLYGKNGAWAKTHVEAVANGTGYSTEMHRKAVPLMDRIICATPQLADEYADWNDNVYVARNSIDPSDWAGLPEREESETLRIGYYGSPSHLKDYPRAKKALKWAARQKDVEVSFIGFRQPGWQGKVFPWEDKMFKARDYLTQIDVGIAPLTRNPWADGKSDVKALEYAMGGVMPILEDAPPYSPWKDMGWEWMPKGEAEWVDAIHDVVAMRDDVPTLARDAKDYVLENRTIEQEIVAWREALGVTPSS
jgi:hypothetical protein